MPVVPGDRVGPYEVLASLGSGGMGEVFRVRDTRLGREVALKVISQGAALNPLAAARFASEARLVAALSHPNVVALYDVGEHQGEPFIVTEVLEGQTLRERLVREQPRAELAQRWATQLALGLAAAHGKGIVHRDLKPENVFVTTDGQLKLLDFGIATVRDGLGTLPGDKALTAPGALLGTPGYMSPEQLRGEPADARSDVFSLGCVLFEMLAGQRPFNGKTPAEAAASVLHQEPARLPARAPWHLQQVAARCLQKRPADRFPSAREVALALEDAGPSGLVPRWRARLAAVALAALAVAALGAGTLFVSTREKPQAAPAASIAVLPFTDLSAAHDLDYLGEGVADELINVLAHARGLRVQSRAASFSFKGQNISHQELGRRLNVATLLQGSVRKSQDRVRITAQLIDCTTGYNLWSETFERNLNDIFALQDDVSAAVAAALRVRLLGGGLSTAAHEYRPGNPEAYAAFLLGRQEYNTGTLEGHRRATEHWKKAVALDPGYARAWAALAIVTATVPLRTKTTTPAEKEAGARLGLELAGKAIALAPELAEGYGARAQIRSMYLHDWQGGLGDYERALALGAFDPEVLIGYGAWGLLPLGRVPEALAALQKASEAEPLNPASWLFLGQAQLAAHDLGAARKSLSRALEVKPGLGYVGYLQTVLELLDGKLAEARAASGRAGGPFKPAALALVAHLDGDAAQERAALAALEAADVSLLLAEVQAFRGEHDAAFAALDRAFEEREDMLAHLLVSPLLEPLRPDPRWRQLLSRMHLPTGMQP